MPGSIQKPGAISLSIAVATVLLPSTGLGSGKMMEPERAALGLGDRAEGQNTDGNSGLTMRDETAPAAIEHAHTSELGGGSSGDENSIDDGSDDDLLAQHPAPAKICYNSPKREFGSSSSMLTESEFPADGGKSGGGGSSGPYKTCEDMYDRCQAIGGKCTKGYPGCDVHSQTSCSSCFSACKAGSSYPPACRCRSCGFT